MRPASQLQRTLFFILMLFCFSANAAGVASSHHQNPIPSIPGDQLKLGVVAFPTSTTSPEAQAHFLQGLRYLHNFMYPLALREFQLANQYDPSFALSYWGMAMCYKWSLWSYENKRAGEKVIQQFKSLKNVNMTPLEKGWINAISLIYQPGTLLANEKKYMEAMGVLHNQFPDDPDVASFYALALIGYATDTPFSSHAKKYLQTARDTLKPFIAKYPSHPGIIHYYIHANDVPNSEFPETALSVAKNVFQYINDSSHVLHMPSHLDTDLGRWSDAAFANALSIHASHRMCHFLESQHIALNALSSLNVRVYDPSKNTNSRWDAKDRFACDADNVYHSMEWLQYEYLQMGQFKKARNLVEQMQKVAAIEQNPKYDFWFYRMKARQILYSGIDKPVKKLPAPLVEKSEDKHWAAYSECGLLLADGFRAVKDNQTTLLTDINARFEKIIHELTAPSGVGFKNACELTHDELLATIAIQRDKNTSNAQKILDHALKIQYHLQSSEESLTLPFLPTQEVYAGLLLQNPTPDNVKKAIALYTNELTFNPNRTEAIIGLARAYAKINNVNSARDGYNKFLLQYSHADDVATLSEAKHYLSEHTASRRTP